MIKKGRCALPPFSTCPLHSVLGVNMEVCKCSANFCVAQTTSRRLWEKTQLPQPTTPPAIKVAMCLTNTSPLLPFLKYTCFNIPVHRKLFPPPRFHLALFLVGQNTKFETLLCSHISMKFWVVTSSGRAVTGWGHWEALITLILIFLLVTSCYQTLKSVWKSYRLFCCKNVLEEWREERD